MYLSIVSTIFSIIFVLMGVASFLPGFFESGLLFGKFQVDKMQAIFYIVVGVIGLFCSVKYKADRLFFRIFGIIFGLAAISGYAWGNIWVTDVNLSDTVLHFFIAVVFLVMGFSADKTGEV